MQEFWLSVGAHRKETNWKNVKFTWPDLVDRLRKCQYTGETVKEYAAMTRDQQSAIKDVGGFVGGIINGGRRKKGAVTSRSIITLDMDSPPVDFWDQFELDFDFTACIYSTHKHTAANPRLRLIIPLDREVLSDEYEAVSRKIAAMIGLDYFDHSTFQPERLMYWPSMPKDGEFLFRLQNSELLAADKILSKYKDWKDVSQWPVHAGEIKKVEEGVKLAADPLEKPGIVGAFCRVHGVADAINTYLSDYYTEAGEGRYTYTGGSTAAGLVVYGDKFAYSHHDTDPCSGILCNAFDLVRIHKFGRLDDRSKEDTPINRRPSYLAMLDLARSNKAVNLDLVRQQTEGAKEAFADEINDEWLKLLETDRKGRIVATSENLLIIFRNDPTLAGRVGYNEFTCKSMVLGALPWDDRQITRGWEDRDDSGLRWYIEKVYGFTAINKIYDCFHLVCYENRYHPVRQYLEGLQWDGRKRLETLLVDFLGAEDNEYVRAVTRKTLIGAVARVMEPGIKFDTMLTIVGPQGSAKSHFINVLGRDWYSDSFGRLDSKEAVEQIQGVWIMEIAELAALKKAEVEVIKHFVSKRVDDFRPAYGHHVKSFPRQCIFIPTSNKLILQDDTGGRRFWPVVIQRSSYFKNKVYNELPKIINQIWAEAVRYWAEDEVLYLPELIEMKAAEVQDDYTEKDYWIEIIEKCLDIHITEDWNSLPLYERKSILRQDETAQAGTIRRDIITPTEVWLEFLDGDRKGLTSVIGRRISDCFRHIRGWEMAKKKGKISGVTTRYYKRKVADVADDI